MTPPELEPRFYAGLVAPGFWEVEILGTEGVDYTSGVIRIDLQLVEPDGSLGPLWSTHAAPTPTLTLPVVEPTRIIARHDFPAAPTVEIPYVAAPLLIDRHKPMHYTLRWDLFTVGGVRLFLPATCLEIYALDQC